MEEKSMVMRHVELNMRADELLEELECLLSAYQQLYDEYDDALEECYNEMEENDKDPNEDEDMQLALLDRDSFEEALEELNEAVESFDYFTDCIKGPSMEYVDKH